MDFSITQEDLEHVAGIYDTIRAAYRRNVPELDHDIAAHFENQVKEIMEQYVEQAELIGHEGEMEVIYYKTKNDQYNLCAQKIVELVSTFDKKLSVVLSQVLVEKD